ncbi:MAG TPA: glycosyltransferase family 2 protein [Desulfobacteraceae bacterium]|nr:glycosyltransferase family 2 protein [Desulfobacteraceae bacterium]HPJ66345.1 glycosyltransferase family 2 protein [Desulfobacteraceae bacterium]HPQ27189.1 glycosyltransferase family 2 protein [Desulfobacteraceae bacterium]
MEFCDSINKKLVVIIPAFNEEASIKSVVGKITAATDGDIVVVNDASIDRTADAAQDAGAKVLSLSLRLGAWGAIRTGIYYAFRHDYHVAVTMDADGQHIADSIQSVVAQIESNHADVVIGSCINRGSPARKLIWNIFRIMTGLEIRDLTSGLRAYNRDAISALISKDTVLFDYQDVGVLLFLRKMGLRITEVPVDMVSRISGHSRVFSSWCDILGYLLTTGILCISRTKQ